jgi:hypothetical protein
MSQTWHARFLSIVAMVMFAVSAQAARAKPVPTPFRLLVTTPKLTQELTVSRKTKKAITFTAKLSGTCQRTITGVAKLKGGDSESGEDENGLMYQADEYRYTAKNGCELIITLKSDDATRATLEEVDCKATCAPVEDLMVRMNDKPGAAAAAGKTPAAK